MDTTGFNPKLGSDSQDSDDLQQPAPPGVERPLIKFATKDIKLPKASPLTPLGVENAKKRLRAFSIQKKTSLSPVPISKGSGAATVFIGKASGVKAFSKPPPEPSPDEAKKPPKPPKPGGATESYILNQKKTLAEIEDMKRKMELVELGIPLGLICPAPDSQWNKAMPTKAMPPIKTFLDELYKENAPPTRSKRRPRFVKIHRDKVDELIREGKKARAEGKEFKFDYRKLLPDYDNPFQRKKEQQMAEPEVVQVEPERKSRDKDKRRSDRYDSKRRSSYKSDEHRRRDDKYKDKSKDKISSRERDRSKEKQDLKHKDQEEKHKGRDVKPLEKEVKTKDYNKPKDGTKGKEVIVKLEEATKESEKEAEVNLKDFVVCDSWSDNDDKSKDSTPKPEGTTVVEKSPLYAELDVPIDPMKQLRDSLLKKDITSSPKPKLKRLNPDAVKFEVVEPDDDEDDDVLDMFNESSSLEKFSQKKKDPEESSMDQLFDFDDEKDETFEGMADDTFLESVINEIKQEEIDENSHDKALVGYDESPSIDTYNTRGSVTPEMDDKTRHLHSSIRSNYSDGYKSTESGYKSTESVKMSDCDLETMVEERKRELERMEESRKINKCTEVSLNMWSFVLKVCQPILFRHDRNKCYKETRIEPKLWYTENPKLCNCVKDRSVVYEELDVYKRKYLDKLYGTEIPQDTVEAGHRGWYPSLQQWPTPPVQAASEWETEDSQAEQRADTPQHHHMLDEEYQRFMATVRPDKEDSKSGTPRSTPSRREASKKKSTEPVDDKNSKRMKMTSEGWSQESELEEEADKSIEKKVKEKRKRKHSTSTSVTDSSESEPKKKKKTQKKKDTKKSKLKDSKRRRVSKKNIKKLKEKQKKKKKTAKSDEDSDVQELEKAKKKKDKKLKKKKLLKQKKKTQKRKKSRAKKSSSDSSDSEPEKKSKKKKKGDKKKKKNKSDAQETQLFDVNILNNIKTERNSEEEQSQMEFSPRKPKVTREIINVKELQNDFVGNSIHVKKEVEENEKRNVTDKQEDSQESQAETAERDSCDLKEEIQSTPQLRPDESNNSQCSSQESVYSLKDQHVYEKDESHLRPSSQNSNYSFHDVMGKFSNKQVEQEKYGFENNSQSQESVRSREQDTRSQDRKVRSDDMRSQEQESRSQEHDRSHHDSRSRESVRSREQDTRSQDRKVRSDDMRSQEQESRSQEHDRSHHDSRSQDELRSHEQSYEYDQHSQQYEIHGIQRHIRDIPRPDSRSRNHDSRSHDHDPRSRAHEPRSHEHDPRTYEHESQSHEVLNEHKVHDMPYKHDMPSHDNLQSHDVQTHADELEYEQGNYEMYEQMAMAYQSDVANQHTSPPDGGGSRRIETLVRARTCGEIKCDWRAGAPLAPPAPANRPSRWGLKPGEVNIVLTGGGQSPSARVYRIQSLANRTDTGPNTGYDEAYMDTYGAADRLQYGDCFSTESSERRNITPVTSSLDDRINRVLRTTVLGEVAQDAAETAEKEREKGILVTKSLSVASRAPKRVSFADGYKPGQDSDVEEPPVKKKKKPRRLGCAWPCPASHPDHVPLWDALPPPPPPPGSPPPPTPVPPPPVHLLRQGRPMPSLLQAPPHHMFGNVVKMESMDEERKFDPTALPVFMPTEPPPGMLAFPNM